MLDKLTTSQTPSLSPRPKRADPNLTAPCLVQFLRHCSASSVVELMESLCDVNDNFARLKDLSQSVAIAGMAKTSSASLLSTMNDPWCAIHYPTGSSVS
ncbi:hypothetical protein MY4824_003511 [Beauveria thailandica]